MDTSAVGINESQTRDLLNHVTEFLGFLDFPGTLKALEAERNEKRAQVSASISTKAISRESREKMRENMLRKYDEGKRDEFMTMWTQYVPASMLGYDLNTQKIEFYLNIYFAVFPILPSSAVLVATPPLVAQQKLTQRMKVFKHFLETRGSGLAHTGEFLMYYALPFVPQPELHPSFEHLFLAGWVEEQRAALRGFLESIAPAREVPKLYLMFESYLNSTDDSTRLSPREQSRRQSVSHRRTPPREREVLAHQMGGQPFSLGRSMSRGAMGSMVADSGGRIYRPVSSLLGSNGRGLVPTNTSQSRLSGAKPPKYTPSHFRPGPSRIPGPPGTAARLLKSNLGSPQDRDAHVMALPQEAGDDVLVGTVEPNMAAQIAQAGAMIASLDPQAGWVVNNTEGFDEEPWGVEPTFASGPAIMLAPLDCDKIKQDVMAGADGTGDSGLAARLLQALRWRLLNSHPGADRWGVLATYIETDLLGCNSDKPILPVLAGASDPLLVEEAARLANALVSDRLGRSYLLNSPTSVPALFQIVQTPTQSQSGSPHAADKAGSTSLHEHALTPVPPVVPRGLSSSRSASGSGSPSTRRIRSQGNMEGEAPEGMRSHSARTPREGKPPTLSRQGSGNGRHAPPIAPSTLSSPGAASAGQVPASTPSTPSSAAMAANAAAVAAPAFSASQQLKMRDSAALQQALVALQKLSLKRSAQSQMIKMGVLQWVVHFTQDASTLSEFTLEYCCALMMNLSLRPSGRNQLEQVAAHLLLLCEKQLESNNDQVRTYVNGTLYSALCRPNIREVARGMGYQGVLTSVMERSPEVFASQIKYIMQQLESDIPPPEEEWAEDKDDNERDLDYDDDDGFADLSMAPESPMHAAGLPQGEQLLCEVYLLTSQEEARTQVDAVRASMAFPPAAFSASRALETGQLQDEGQKYASDEDGVGAEHIAGISGYSASFASAPSSHTSSAQHGEVIEDEALPTNPPDTDDAGEGEIAEEVGGEDGLPPLGTGPEPSAPSRRSRSLAVDASTVLSGSVVLGATGDRSAGNGGNVGASMSMTVHQSVAARSMAKSSLMRVDSSKPMSRPITPSLLSSSLQGHALRASNGLGNAADAGSSFIPEMPPVEECAEGSPGPSPGSHGGLGVPEEGAHGILPAEGDQVMEVPQQGAPPTESAPEGFADPMEGQPMEGQEDGMVLPKGDEVSEAPPGQAFGRVGQSGQFGGGVGHSRQSAAAAVGQSGQLDAGSVGQSGQCTGGIGQSGQFAAGVRHSGQSAAAVGMSRQFSDGVRRFGHYADGAPAPSNGGSRPGTAATETPHLEAGLDTPNMAEANFAGRPTSADIDPMNLSAPIEPPPLSARGSGAGPSRPEVRQSGAGASSQLPDAMEHADVGRTASEPSAEKPQAVVLEISGGVSFTGKPPNFRKPPDRIRKRMNKPSVE